MTEMMIEAAGLNKYFSDFHVLRNIDLQVKSGERVVLCGPSGSGKSTLIRCLNGLELHQGGKLLVCGIALTNTRKSIDLVRRRTGMVFQSFNLFPHMTAVENCMVAPMRVRGLTRDEARAVAEKFLRRVHVEDQINKYPAQLSGGQQQRVAIARALAMNPDVMLFDEPTSALDPEMVGEVLDTMTEIANQGTTMICVTHEMGFARKIADRVVFMDAGAIVESAPPEEFFTRSRTPRAREFLSWVMH